MRIVGRRAAASFAIVVALAKPPACPAQEFTEEAISRGLLYHVQQTATFGSGVAFVDLDQDHDPDVVVLGKTTVGFPSFTVGVFENDGEGNFSDRSIAAGIPALPWATGVTAADYDGDGDLDLHIACWLTPDRLLRNDGGFTFTDVSLAAGIADEGAGEGCGWGDFDGDGWLDLYVANRTGTNQLQPPYLPSVQPNRLYRNQGDGTFVDVAGSLGVDGLDDRTFQAVFLDFDRDADADLYLANDKGASTGCQYRNRLYENVGGLFVDVSQNSGTDGCIDAMCIAVGDLDGNGLPDLYVSNIPQGNPLYLNNGDGTFTEAGDLYGVASYEVGWGSLFFDYNHDGWLDLYVCQHRDFEPNHLFEYNGTPPAVDVAPSRAVADAGASFTCAAADVDDDGDVDLLVANAGGKLKLYINPTGSSRSWVKFRVAGIGANRFAVGAQVDVRTGTHGQLREVLAGSAFKSQDDLTLHFGLDQANVLDEIRVTWPGGCTRSLSQYPARETWTLYPPADLGDANGDGAVNREDFGSLRACFDRAVSPGCEMLDMNGDGRVNALDLPDFLAQYADPLLDCDGSGSADLVDILLGTAPDIDGNAIPDSCETDRVRLDGPIAARAGQPVGVTFSGAPPGAPYVLYASDSLTGSTIQGHAFDLGSPRRILAIGLTDAAGSATVSPAWTMVPVGQVGSTLYLEVRVDGAATLYDSNPHEMQID